MRARICDIWSLGMAMTVNSVNRPSVLEMGETLAKHVREEEIAKDLWAQERRGVAEFWLVTEPIGWEAELRLYKLGLDLYSVFPNAEISLHVLNPGAFVDVDVDDLMAELIPANAKHLGLR